MADELIYWRDAYDKGYLKPLGLRRIQADLISGALQNLRQGQSGKRWTRRSWIKEYLKNIS